MPIQEILQQLTDDFFKMNSSATISAMIEDGVIDSTAIERQWLGNDPASESQIVCNESRLRVTLPNSYCEFFRTSNGFRFLSPFLDNLLPIEQVHWARNKEEAWWLDLIEEDIVEVSDELYLNYENQSSVKNNRVEYFRKSLKVSDWYDGMCIFLNPEIQHEGEWEVLEYATWYPGWYRYRSFQDYLVKVHESNLRLQNAR
jgi:hypothetical protein